MEIVGYSERGAMNTLFYGIALNNDEEAFKRFLNEAQIRGEISNVNFYMEFSMSEFGSPDLLITAKINNVMHILFIEAKASCGKNYSLIDAWKKHKKFKEDKDKYDGYSSNLYYQLEMKKIFFDNKNEIGKTNEIKKGIDGRKHKVGNNPVVKKICDIIYKCEEADYIAIVPKSDVPNDGPSHIKYVYWEELTEKFKDKNYLQSTLEINKGEYKSVSQILNN